MPILNVHLVDGLHSAEQHERLLVTMSARYADILSSPLGRVRAYLTLHHAGRWATGGVLASAEPVSAPYFTAIVLEGRPVEQRQRLLHEFTDILVDVLGARRDLIRGQIIQVHPDDWAIGGVPASVKREAEIRARAG